MAILESMTVQEDLDERHAAQVVQAPAASSTNNNKNDAEEEIKTIEVADSDDEDLPIGAAGLHVKPAAASTKDGIAANSVN